MPGVCVEEYSAKRRAKTDSVSRLNVSALPPCLHRVDSLVSDLTKVQVRIRLVGGSA